MAETKIVMNQEEYDSLIAQIKILKEEVEDYKNNLFTVGINYRGDITYLKNAPEKIQMIWDSLQTQQEKSKEWTKDYEVKMIDLKYELKKSNEKYEDFQKEIHKKIMDYNMEGSWYRFWNNFTL